MSVRIEGIERIARITKAMPCRMELAIAADVRPTANAALANARGER